MALSNPIWPSFEALDALWDSDEGHALAQNQALWVEQVTQQHIPARARILLIGPVAPAVIRQLETLRPNCLFQAFPPAIGVRPGLVPALLMDTDLPPFARANFDLILVSNVLEFRSTPLALLSLCYEILHPQGRLITFVPHRLSPRVSRPGQGMTFLNMEMGSLLKQSAFTPVHSGLARMGRLAQGHVRPATLMNLAAPQYPPKPAGGLPVWPSIPKLWRQRPAAGWAHQKSTVLRSPKKPG